MRSKLCLGKSLPHFYNLKKFHTHTQMHVRTVTRGVTRLDGVRGKKQVWRPHIRIGGLWDADALY